MFQILRPARRGVTRFIQRVPQEHLYAQGAIELPAIEIDGYGYVVQPNQGQVEIPSISIVGYGGASGKIEISIKVSGTGTLDVIGSGTVELPSFVVAGTAVSGGVGTGKVKLPAFEIVGYGGSHGSIVLPAIRVAGSGVLGTVGSGVIEIPAPTIAGIATLDDVAIGSVVIPAIQIHTNSGLITIPAIEINGGIAIGAPLTAGALSAYVMNVKTGAVTNYSNFTFDFIVRFHDKFYGVKSDGIYLLEGADDGGAAIAAHIKTPKIDFGTTRHKRVPYLYAGSSSDITVTATVDGAVGNAHQSVLGQKRVRLERGPHGRYWEFNIANVSGGQLQLDRIELLAQALNRKV